MSVEICVYLKKKPKEYEVTPNPTEGLTYENIADKALFYDFFGGSWILFEVMEDVGFNSDAIVPMTDKFFNAVKNGLTRRVSEIKAGVDAAANLADYLKENPIECIEDIGDYADYIKYLKDELTDAESALVYWINFAHTMDYNDILFTCSY